MLPRIHLGWIGGCLLAGLLAGCGTGAAGKRGAADSPSALTEDYSPEAVERRTDAHAHYAEAVLSELNEQPARAAEEYFEAARADHTNEALVLEVSRLLLHEKMNDRALELLRSACAEPRASGVLFARLGLIYALMGEKAEAIAANRQAIKRSPRSLHGYQHLSQMHLQDGRPEEAFAVLDQAAAQKGVDAAYLTELGQLYVAYGRASGREEEVKERAAALFDRAAAFSDKNPLLLQRLAEGFVTVGQGEKAVAIYDQLLEQMPNMPGLREKLAELYLRREDRKRAAQLLEDIVRDNPTNPQAYYFLGAIAMEDEQAEKAAGYFRKAILVNPGFEQAYYQLAAAQLSGNEPRAALSTLQKAREKFEQSFLGEFFSALAYSRMEDYSKAITHFTAAEVIARATETNRLTYTFYFQLGAAHERVKHYEEAENYFRKCLELQPDFGEALNYLGYMWAEQGVKLEEAHDMIGRAVKLEPDNGAFLDSMAWVLFKMGRAEEALSFQLKAVEHSPKPDVTLFEHLGDIYAALKQPEKAREAWRKALEVQPSDALRKKIEGGPPGNGGP